jgi:O-acetyl-ADP-ribose deacetylase (regulator of RNase III)
MSAIRITDDDITTLAVDAMVNAANDRLQPGGGVCGAIYRAAGPGLVSATAALGGCPTGEARITPGFELPARYVIHAVGPRWMGGRRGEPALLTGAHRASFALALEHGVRSIALPAISCGIYGYPPEQAAPIAIAEARRAIEAAPGLQVTFACPDPDVRRAYQRAFSEG